MDSKELEQFAAVVECGSISKAAKRLFISSQGLGKNVRKLEGEFGVRLFDRTSNGVVPTQAGQVLYEHTQKLLEDFEAVRSSMKTESHGKLVIPIFCTYGSPTFLGVTLFEEFRRQRPDIVLKVQEAPDARVDDALRCGEAEVGIIAGPVDMLSYDAHYLGSTDHVAVISRRHPLARKPRISYADLNNQEIIMVGEEFRPYQNVQNRLAKAGITPSRITGIGEIRKVAQTVKRTLGVGISVAFEMADDPYPGTVVIPFADETLTWDLFLVHPSDHVLSDGARAFCQFLMSWVNSGKAEFS